MNNRDVITFQSRMSSGAERVMSIEADEAASVAAELLQQVEIAEKREEGDNAKVAAKLGRGVTAKTTSSSRKQKHPVGSKEHGVQRVERAMEVLSARNQRHKLPSSWLRTKLGASPMGPTTLSFTRHRSSPKKCPRKLPLQLD